MEMSEGYVKTIALDSNNEIIGYEYVSLGKMMDAIKAGMEPNEAFTKYTNRYGRYDEAVRVIDPRKE